MEEALRQAKNYGAPVIVHAITEKGRGYQPALDGCAPTSSTRSGRSIPRPGSRSRAASKPSWTAVFGDELVELAAANPQIVGVTAAMLRPTGLHKMAERFPDRVTDVGIAEQHAVTSAAGMAFGGLPPGGRDLRDVHQPRLRPGAHGCRPPRGGRDLRARPRRCHGSGRTEPPRDVGSRDPAGRAEHPHRSTARRAPGSARSSARRSRWTTHRPCSVLPRVGGQRVRRRCAAQTTALMCCVRQRTRTC